MEQNYCRLESPFARQFNCLPDNSPKNPYWRPKPPGDALRVEQLNLVDRQDGDAASRFAIEEIDISGADGEIKLQGEQARKSFVAESKKVYTLTYHQVPQFITNWMKRLTAAPPDGILFRTLYGRRPRRERELSYVYNAA